MGNYIISKRMASGVADLGLELAESSLVLGFLFCGGDESGSAAIGDVAVCWI